MILIPYEIILQFVIVGDRMNELLILKFISQAFESKERTFKNCNKIKCERYSLAVERCFFEIRVIYAKLSSGVYGLFKARSKESDLSDIVVVGN